MSSSDDKKENKKQGSQTTVQTSAEIEFVARSSSKPPKGPPRYRDPANPFNTWGGRGKRPDWLTKYLNEGHDITEFVIKNSED